MITWCHEVRERRAHKRVKNRHLEESWSPFMRSQTPTGTAVTEDRRRLTHSVSSQAYLLGTRLWKDARTDSTQWLPTLPLFLDYFLYKIKTHFCFQLPVYVEKLRRKVFHNYQKALFDSPREPHSVFPWLQLSHISFFKQICSQKGQHRWV